MAPSLNVIALVSGGKDSYFSMLHCIAQGHRIVALANLHPPLQHSKRKARSAENGSMNEEQAPSAADEIDDMNSFMYQTVGHTLVPLQAKALEMPLYRQAINGTAIDTSRDYATPRSGPSGPNTELSEETECLTTLLRRIQIDHPDVNAVCSGAILSDYQRTRIESVAIRLGLIPLAFLWQYPTLSDSSGESLLDDMSRLGFDIRLVKVASGGLDQSHLWTDMMNTSTRSRIRRIMSKYGGNILGEGGEYETLVLRGPSPIWRKLLLVDDKQIRTNTEAGGSSYASFPPQSITSSIIPAEEPQTWLSRFRQIPLWDDTFVQLKKNVIGTIQTRPLGGLPFQGIDVLIQYAGKVGNLKTQRQYVGPFLHISNIFPSIPFQSVSDQMATLKHEIIAQLQDIGKSTRAIVFTTMILRSVSRDFTSVNHIYSELFDRPNPPARVTISSKLPEGYDVTLSLVINLNSQSFTRGLHVQSQSYWAPANIGPYSQAISADLASEASLVYVAGQIPLIPASMKPLNDGPETNNRQLSRLRFIDDTCLSLQHMWRIGRLMQVVWWVGSVVYVSSSDDVPARVESIFRVWAEAHDARLWPEQTEDEGSVDPWDAMYGNQKILTTGAVESVKLPDFERLTIKGTGASLPGIFAVQAAELPRKCNVEWQGVGIARASITLERSEIAGFDAISCLIGETGYKVFFISVPWPQNPDVQIQSLISIIPRDHSSAMTIYTHDYRNLADFEAQIIPCESVWRPSSLGAERLAAGVILHSSPKQGAPPSEIFQMLA